jgi:hypothetical protein
MPANIVKPGEEAAWERAKKKAAEQGHEKDWPYIVAIFQKMKGGMSKSFTIPPAYRRVSIPGQVPGRERLPRELRRMTDKPAPLTQEKLERYDDRPMLRPEAVPKGLGFSREEESTWARFVAQTARTAANELTFRQMALEKFRAERLPVETTKALLQRGLAYWREIQKSFVRVEALTPEEMAKAMPRGGKYHRRVPKAGGGYTYVYDEATYQKRQDAHIDGEAASVAYVTDQVLKCVGKAGEAGCRASAFKPLVQKYGAEKLAQILEGNAGGKISFKGGKFKLVKEAEGDSSEKSSQ